jgi:hypothetical protein
MLQPARLACRALVLAAACAACASSATIAGLPADEAPPVQVLRDAFFTAYMPSGGRTYRTPDEVAQRTRRFGVRDEKMHFVVVLDPRYGGNVRGTLFRPNGDAHGTLAGDVQAMLGGTWRTQSWWWSLQNLRRYPGDWHLDLLLDNQPAGRYYFRLDPGR